MVYALTESAARLAEERAVAEAGVTLGDLMRRAGTAVAEALSARVPFGPVAVVTGKGNNGGDGWLAARVLASAGRDVRVFSLVDPAALKADAGEVAAEAIRAGVAHEVVSGEMASNHLEGYAAVVDALLGIGTVGEIQGSYVSAVQAINASGAHVISVDLPTGVLCDTGAAPGVAVRADATVTFSSQKAGLVLQPGVSLAGDVLVSEIGIPRELVGSPGDPEVWSAAEYRDLLPVLDPDTHKNARGRVLIVAGSGAYPGAAALAAMGAQRMGAGYVTLAVPESIAHIVQSKLTSAVVMGLPEHPSHTLASRVTDIILDLSREFDAVVIGPGMTVAHGAVLVTRNLVHSLMVPLVLDADGLNAMVDAADAIRSRVGSTVITPHPGELSRLLDMTPTQVQSDRLVHGAKLSGPNLTCVLKGARTVISGQGRRVVNTTGNPGLATAGTGDVLAGMVGALLAQGLSPLEAGALGAWVHGRAGDHAARELTETCMIAEDVPNFISSAVRELNEQTW
ncbi:MAG: NAD(P)H-hydrate dehydratase [Actinomycetota bacterium]|nr:NAD(P)H-hydrate dehydratase [Actinomycetota bacterium]